MKIKWVNNSRVKDMAAMGIIDAEDIITRCSTALYPAETATVAMRDVQSKSPWVSVHIRGSSKGPAQFRDWGTNSQYPQAWIAAQTMRVNFGHDYKHKSLSGELCETLDFAQVDKAVTQITAAMEA